jgi:hypothetical protein
LAGYCVAGEKKPDGGGGLAGCSGRCGYRQQAGPAEAAGVVGGDEGPIFGGQPDTITLALGDVARAAFEGRLTTGTIFGFSPGRRGLGRGGLGHGGNVMLNCGIEGKQFIQSFPFENDLPDPQV